LSLRISIGTEFGRQRSYIWWVVNRLAYLAAITNLATFLVFFVQERFPELTAEKAAAPAANVVMFVGVFILLSAIPSGWLGDRFGKKPLIAISGVLAAIGTLIVVLTPGLAMLYVGGCIIGAGAGLFYSVNWALGTEIVPQDKAGQFLGMQNLAGAGAGAIGAYIGGPIADNTSYVLLMGIYALLFILSLIPLIGVEESRS
jgi:MFS family permease